MTPEQLDVYITQRDAQGAMNMKQGRDRLKRNRELFPTNDQSQQDHVDGNTEEEIVDEANVPY